MLVISDLVALYLSPALCTNFSWLSRAAFDAPGNNAHQRNAGIDRSAGCSEEQERKAEKHP